MLVHHRIPSIKWLGVLLLLLDGTLVHHRIPSIKWLGVLLLPPGWDASLSQDTVHFFGRLNGLLVTTIHRGGGGDNMTRLEDQSWLYHHASKERGCGNQSRTLDPEVWRVNYEVITTRINFRSFSNAQAKSAFQPNSLFYIWLSLYWYC